MQRIESQNHNRETKHYVRFQESIKRLQVQNALKDKLSKFHKCYEQKLSTEEKDIKKMLRELKKLVSLFLIIFSLERRPRNLREPITGDGIFAA